MKTKRICKSTVSLLLVFMMLVSMFTVGIVSTSAAETDVATTGASGIKLRGVDGNWNKDYEFVLSSGTTYYVDVTPTKTGSQWIQINYQNENHTTKNCSKINDVVTDVEIVKNDQNFEWYVSTGGTYRFTFNTSTMKLTVTNPNAGGGGGNEDDDDGGDITPPTGGDIKGGTILYLEPTGLWDNANAWFNAKFTKDSTTQYVKAELCNKGESPAVYRVVVPEGEWDSIQWRRMNSSATSNTGNVWGSSAVYNSTHIGVNNLFTVETYNGGTWKKFTGNDLIATQELENTEKIYFIDKSNVSNNANQKDEKYFAVISGTEVYEMRKTVDTLSGNVMWVAELDKPANTEATVVFHRTSVFATEDNLLNKTTWWQKWDAGKRNKKITYVATTSTDGSWPGELIGEPSSIVDFSTGLWADAKGNGNITDAVKCYKAADKVYHLYLPSYANTSSLNLYTSYDSVVLKGGYYNSTSKQILKNVPNTVNFREGTTEYTLTINGVDNKLKVYKSANAATMLMNTKHELYTGLMETTLKNSESWPSSMPGTDGERASEYKEAIKTSGTYFFYDETGSKVNTSGGEKAETLKSIKGRGNSTFEASTRVYGKYAYNFNLDTTQELIEGATASKKWCLLANNVDPTMLRNTFIYSLADDIGLKYAPETRLVDLYDNGNYLGAYILTEKVEYGSGTLMDDLKNLDDYNEKFCKNAKTTVPEDSPVKTGTHSVAESGNTYEYQCRSFTGPSDFDEYNFLLEFELYNRYTNEHSWFKSKRTGQAVVVKYPEFANEQQMEWIIEMYDKAETAIYANNTADIQDAIDVDSFAKMYLIQELSINLDGCATSYYMYNNGKKLYASPVWDYDWAFGSYMNKNEGGNKYISDGTNCSPNSTTLDNPKQMFAKFKALKTDKDHNPPTGDLNFQAKLAQNDAFWKECQLIYTNFFVPAMDNYIYNNVETEDGTAGFTSEDKLLNEWLPKFKVSLAMNDARWKCINAIVDGWGSKKTTTYATFKASSSDKVLGIGSNTAGAATASYNNGVYYLNDWIATRWNYLSSKTENKDHYLYLDNEKYEFTSDPIIEAKADEHTVTITASAGITKGSGSNAKPLDASKITVELYANGELKDKYKLDQFPVTRDDIQGGIYRYQIKVYPTDYDSLYKESNVSTVQVTYAGALVETDIFFKSSGSYRYTPTLVYNGVEYPMERYGDAIAKNPYQVQEFYWYKVTIEAIYGEPLKLSFKNEIAMNASITIDSMERSEYYLAVNNMNTGDKAEDLSDWDEMDRNTCKSAVNMIKNDYNEAGLAVTSFDGGYYILGDTDTDDKLTIMDVTMIQMALAQKTQLTGAAEKLADFTLDGTMSINDATGIQINLTQ